MKSILIVKFWALGDILMATPILRALKRQWPECEIDWLVDKGYADVLRGNPLIREAIGFDSAAWRREFRYGRIGAYLKRSISLRRMLKAKQYDAVLVLTGEKWWSAWFTVAPIRVGLFPREKPGYMSRLYTHVVERQQKPWLHSSRHYLQAARALGIPEPYDEWLVVGVIEEHRDDVATFLEGEPAYRPDRPILVLHPGTSQYTKCWLPKYYARVADEFLDYNVVLTGSPGERELCESILGLSKRRNILISAGRLGKLGQTAALLERAGVVVTGDTSVLHIASALGTPLVGVYGSTRPGDNAPLFGPQDLVFDDTVECAPCYSSSCRFNGDKHMRCMRQIAPDDVIAALRRLGVQSVPSQASHV